MGSISKDQPCNANEYKEEKKEEEKEEEREQQGRNPILVVPPCRPCVFAIVNAVVEARTICSPRLLRLNGN